MKRLFYQSKIYDYNTITSAEKHIEEMTGKGWYAKIANKEEFGAERYIFKNAGDVFPYTVEYFKEI